MYSSYSSLTDTESDTDERRSVDEQDFGACGDRFPYLTIHQSRDSSLPAEEMFTRISQLYAVDKSSQAGWPLTNIEDGIDWRRRGAEGLEDSGRSDWFPELIHVQPWDPSLFADGKYLKASHIHTVDDSPRACLSLNNTEGTIYWRSGVDGLDVGACSDRFPDLTIHQSRDSSLSADEKFIGTSLKHALGESPKAGWPLTNIEEGIDWRRRGAEGLEVSGRSDRFPDLIHVRSWDPSLSTDGKYGRECLSLDDTEGSIDWRRGVDELEASGRSDQFSDMTIHQSQDLSLSADEKYIKSTKMVDDSPKEKQGKGRKKAGIRGFFERTLEAVKLPFLSGRKKKVEPIVPPLQPDTRPPNSGLFFSRASSLDQRPDACPAVPKTHDTDLFMHDDTDFSEEVSDMSTTSMSPNVGSIDEMRDVDSPEEQHSKEKKKAGIRGFFKKSLKKIKLPLLSCCSKAKVEPVVPPLQPDTRSSHHGLSASRASSRQQSPDACPAARPSIRFPLPAPGPSCFEPTEGDVEDLYKFETLLGAGAFGMVYEGTRIADGRKVAIKVLSKFEDDEHLVIPGHSKPLLTEVALMLMMKNLISPNVIQIYEWFEDPYDITIVMEYPQPCQSLEDFISEYDMLSERLACILMYQAVKAVMDCVNHGVFHSDIHPGNILVNTNTLNLKVIDFGCGQLYTSAGYEKRQYIGNEKYCPPEVLVRRRFHAIPANVWSLGLILYKMVNGCLPPDKSEDVVFVNPNLSVACRSLIRKCLLHEPEERPTLEQILQHRWFVEE